MIWPAVTAGVATAALALAGCAAPAPSPHEGENTLVTVTYRADLIPLDATPTIRINGALVHTWSYLLDGPHVVMQFHPTDVMEVVDDE